jgi:hypothetical protein
MTIPGYNGPGQNVASGSAIPGALAQFMIVASAALPAKTTVWFGEELPTYTSPLTLQISEITGDQVPAEIGPNYRREETFTLVCSLSTYQGGPPDFPTILNNLMAQFIILSRAVANNPNLNQAVRFAQVGNFIITPASDMNGQSAVTLDFSVRCEARVTSIE